MAIYEVYTESKKATADGKIELRDEQMEAVAKAKYAFEAEFTAKRPFHKFLWNAKMRFGKTLCAMQLAKERGFKRTLIVTHRPVVNQSWKEDFKKIFQDDPNWRYGTKFEDHQDGSRTTRPVECHYGARQCLRFPPHLPGKVRYSLCGSALCP